MLQLYTVEIFSRGLLATRRPFVEFFCRIFRQRTRVWGAHKTTNTVFMKITIALINKAFLLRRATAVAVAAIAIPSFWVASGVSSRLAVDSRSFVNHDILD